MKQLRKLLPKSIKDLYAILRMYRNPYYRRIGELDISRSGVSEDGTPFIELKNGRIFYSYLPTRAQRIYYRFLLDQAIKEQLIEDCLNVAADIVIRYIGPAHEADFIGQGKYYDLAEGDTVVEVGAFIGFYSMRIAEVVGTLGRVVAIEAIDENFQLLTKNIEANKLENVSVVHRAAWNSAGTLNFERNSRQQASAISNIVNNSEQLTVNCDTIDNILKNSGVSKTDFVRIQVNGAESEVLEGMSITLNAFPKLLIAAIYNRSGQPNWMNLRPLLERMGYDLIIARGTLFASKK